MAGNYVDFGDIFKEIDKLGKNLDRVRLSAVEEAGAFAAKELAKNVPYDSETEDHLKDHVIYSKPTKANPISEVGFDKEVAWRAHFVQFGTIKQRPQDFIEKTMREIQDEVQSIIVNNLKEALK